MENKNLIYNFPSSIISVTDAERLKLSYKHFFSECAKLIPNVHPKLLLDLIYFETSFKDWEGVFVKDRIFFKF